MRVSFHGAAGGVTGSCHLVECGGRKLLVDCGLFQGSRELEEDNAGPFGFDPAEVDWVLLTHAHLDHCGRLPLLTRRGFKGEVVATAATRELARLVLLDAGNLNEEAARRRARRTTRRGRPEEPAEPLFTVLDALNVDERFGRHPAALGKPRELAPGVRATYLEAGHILGSASVLLELDEGSTRRRLLFSGDLGSGGRPLLRDPAPPPAVDAVVLETTYGDRRHKPLDASVEELFAAIRATWDRGGNVLIPTFALERAQELLFHLGAGLEQGKLPRGLSVFLDSPMAISATEIFRHHPSACAPAVAELLRQGRDPFGLPGLRFTREAGESMALNGVARGAVIMAGAGMCTGGRIRHHLRHNLGREACSVVFVGFAAQGTLARRIIDGASTVRLFDEELPVRARIHTINGFSAHADQAELLAWHAACGAGRTFLVHGDDGAREAFAGRLQGTRVEQPALHQGFEL